MTRDEAARVLKAQADYYGKLFASMITAGDYSELRELETRMEALEVGADALREQGWVRTSERLPTVEDADKDDHVLVVTAFGNIQICHYEEVDVGYEHGLFYSYWMPFPPKPEDTL